VKPIGASITEYDLLGSPTVERFIDCRTPVQAIMGPFGSGKTVGAVVKGVEIAHQMPPSPDGIRHVRIVIVRNTYGELRDTTMRTVYDWLPPSKWGITNSENHSYMIQGFKELELELMFRALDRPDHVQKMLGGEFSHAYLNECREIPKEIIGPLRGRLGRFPRRQDVGEFNYMMWMDTNPPDASEDSWFYQMFEVAKPAGCELFKQPSGRSPQAENLRNLPEGYYERMIETMGEDEIRVYVDGEYGFLKRGKPVYPDYKDNWHCKEFEVGRYPVLRCWDFGLTPACVFLQVTPTGQVRQFDEIVSDRAGIKAFTPLVVKHTTQQYPWARGELIRDIGDPSGEYGSTGQGIDDERSCYQIMEAAGVWCLPGVQEPTTRLEAVRHLLRTAMGGEPGFLLHPRCTRTRKGFQGEYHYRRLAIGGGIERHAEKPDKNKYSHPHDALQYGAVELVGDRILGLSTLADIRHQQQTAISDFDPLAVGYAQRNTLDQFLGTERHQHYGN
jgi:hypothetical protein